MSTARPPDERPPAGMAEVDRAIARAERAQDKFARELAGLIEDLHEAREAIRATPLPGEGGGDDREREGR